jgi:hypothetical protein
MIFQQCCFDTNKITLKAETVCKARHLTSILPCSLMRTVAVSSIRSSSSRGGSFLVSWLQNHHNHRRHVARILSFDLNCFSLGTSSRNHSGQYHNAQRRDFSSNNNNNNRDNSRRFKLDGLPFSVSPEEALQAFRKWAEDDQGLRYLMSYSSVRIGAAYVPVWSFDVNIRFKQEKGSSSTVGAPSTWKPPMFSVYDSGSSKQSTIFVPGLASYAGYSYRRSLVNPVHSTSLVFLGEKTQPFGGWMLKDMYLASSGLQIEVVPDAWNATQGRAFSVVKAELQDIVNDAWTYEFGDDDVVGPPDVQTQVVSSRRVMMPTYVIDYSILGLSYRAFVSGCDRSAPVSGVSHQLFGSHNLFQSPEFHQNSRNFLTQVATGTQQFLKRFNLRMLIWIIRPFATILWFVFVRLFTIFPVVGALGGAFAGFRKVIQPWMDTRRASAEWERERDHETTILPRPISMILPVTPRPSTTATKPRFCGPSLVSTTIQKVISTGTRIGHRGHSHSGINNSNSNNNNNPISSHTNKRISSSINDSSSSSSNSNEPSRRRMNSIGTSTRMTRTVCWVSNVVQRPRRLVTLSVRAC